MTEKQETSNILSVLDEIGLEYRQRGNSAYLMEHDSLTIQLSGKYKDSWMRWSTGDSGRGAKQLIQYLVQIGTVDIKDLKDAQFDGIKKVKVKKTEPFNYDTMVTNPRPQRAKWYLTEERQISPLIVDRLFELGKIVQDGRDNVRFLWECGEGNFTGGDVQGTRPDPELKRGAIKYALPGSKGLFFVKDGHLDQVKDAKFIYLVESPIDLLSFLELTNIPEDERENYPESLPTLKDQWVVFSLSGAGSKVPRALQTIQKCFGVHLSEVTFVAATDNDDAGDEVEGRIEEMEFKVQRLRPNNGNVHALNGGQVVKDWNDLLKLIKK